MDRTEIIEALNKDLRAELSAVELYAAHARVISEDRITEGVRAILAVEQRHVCDLTARIRALGGTPAEPGGSETIVGRATGAASAPSEWRPLKSAGAQAATADTLRLELAEEQQAIKDYATQIADIMDDDETVVMLEEHLVDEMQHARWLKAQIVALSR